MGIDAGQARCFRVGRGRFTGLYVADPKPADSEGLCLAFDLTEMDLLRCRVLVPLTNQDVAGLRDYFTKDQKP